MKTSQAEGSNTRVLFSI